MVSQLAFGTWQLGGDWGPTDTAEAMDAIRRAVDEGVTFFDTAQAYGFGQSEQLLSAALRREESRGCHVREEFPVALDEWKRRLVLTATT